MLVKLTHVQSFIMPGADKFQKAAKDQGSLVEDFERSSIAAEDVHDRDEINVAPPSMPTLLGSHPVSYNPDPPDRTCTHCPAKPFNGRDMCNDCYRRINRPAPRNQGHPPRHYGHPSRVNGPPPGQYGPSYGQYGLPPRQHVPPRPQQQRHFVRSSPTPQPMGGYAGNASNGGQGGKVNDGGVGTMGAGTAPNVAVAMFNPFTQIQMMGAMFGAAMFSQFPGGFRAMPMGQGSQVMPALPLPPPMHNQSTDDNSGSGMSTGAARGSPAPPDKPHARVGSQSQPSSSQSSHPLSLPRKVSMNTGRVIGELDASADGGAGAALGQDRPGREPETTEAVLTKSKRGNETSSRDRSAGAGGGGGNKQPAPVGIPYDVLQQRPAGWQTGLNRSPTSH